MGNGPTLLAVGVGGGCLELFSLRLYHISFLYPPLWEMAKYRLIHPFQQYFNHIRMMGG